MSLPHVRERTPTESISRVRGERFTVAGAAEPLRYEVSRGRFSGKADIARCPLASYWSRMTLAV